MKKQIILLVILITLIAYSTVFAVANYNVTTLPMSGNYQYAVNDNRQVVGGTGSKAFLWSSGTALYIENFGAKSVNNSGLIAGGTGNDHAAIWMDGVVTDIGVGYAVAVNNNDQVLVDASYGYNPYIWQNGQITQFGNIGRVTGINDMGDIIGYSQGVGFLFKNGVKVDLGSINGQNCIPWAINNLGQVVGDAGSRAFIWDEIHGAVAISNDYSIAYSINDNGQVVGDSSSGGFLWENGVTTNLNSFMPTGSTDILAMATGINNNGDIVGHGYWSNPIDPTNVDLFVDHPYLLTAIPEPASLLLLGLGSIILRKGHPSA
jgi:uncharacterized membrane protein